jgi:CTP:molybdopterin cytidylyltransferase MocA
MTAGVILAAGRSIRMGRSKALLLAPDGQTFVARLAGALHRGGVGTLFVVGRPDDQPLRLEVEAHAAHARWIENPDADSGGQLSSLLTGLRKADRPGIRAVVVVPVDAPMIAAETVAMLLSVFTSTHAPIVRARYRGRNGHPVVFSRAMFDELRRADPSLGAKAVLRAHRDAIVEVDVDDPGVAGDVDTPEEYQQLVADTTTEEGKGSS